MQPRLCDADFMHGSMRRDLKSILTRCTITAMRKPRPRTVFAVAVVFFLGGLHDLKLLFSADVGLKRAHWRRQIRGCPRCSQEGL